MRFVGFYRTDTGLKARFSQLVTLQNISNTALPAPISLVLDGLRNGTSLINASGTTPQNSLRPSRVRSPYINPSLGGATSFAPGATTSVTLDIASLFISRGTDYGARVLAGSGAR